MGTFADADVVIVGGGLAGLTCAVGLVESGLRVVVLEAGRLRPAANAAAP